MNLYLGLYIQKLFSDCEDFIVPTSKPSLLITLGYEPEKPSILKREELEYKQKQMNRSP
jgi:hypothetical protein